MSSVDLSDLWSSRTLLAELNSTVEQGPTSLDELRQLLFRLRAILIDPLNFPKRDETAKREVQSGKVVLDKEYKLSAVFVQQALDVSQLLDLNELAAVDLLRLAQQQAWRFPDTDSALVAVSEGFDFRHCRLLALRSVLSVAAAAVAAVAAGAPVSPAAGLLQQFAAELLADGLLGRLLSSLRAQLADLGRAESPPALAAAAAAAAGPLATADVTDWKRREAALVAQCVLDACTAGCGPRSPSNAVELVQAMTDALAMPGAFVSTATAAAASTAGAVVPSQLLPAPTGTVSAAAGSSAALQQAGPTGGVGGMRLWAFEVVARLLLAWQALLESSFWPAAGAGWAAWTAQQTDRIHALLSSPPQLLSDATASPSGAAAAGQLVAAGRLSWSLAQLQGEVARPQQQLTPSSAADALLTPPLDAGALAGWRLVVEHARRRGSGWPTDVRQTAMSVAHSLLSPLFAQRVAFFCLSPPPPSASAADLLQQTPSRRQQPTQQQQQQQQRQQTPPHLAALLTLAAVVYQDEPELAELFFPRSGDEDGTAGERVPWLAEFVREAGSVAVALPELVFVPYLRLLAAFCSAPDPALGVFRLLASPSALPPLNWSHWFAALQNVLHDMSSMAHQQYLAASDLQQAAPAAAAGHARVASAATAVRGAHHVELAQPERDGLQAILHLIGRVAAQLDGPLLDEFGMVAPDSNAAQQPLLLLLGLLGCPLPPSFKAAAVRALRQFVRSRQLALLVWRQLAEHSGVLLAGLRVELDEDEPASGDYGYTVAWLKLLRALLAALPFDVAAAGQARSSSLQPLFGFFTDIIWMKSDSRFYAANAAFDRWAVAKHCLKLFYQLLNDSVRSGPPAVAPPVDFSIQQSQLSSVLGGARSSVSWSQLTWTALAATGPHGVLAKLQQLILLPFSSGASAGHASAGPSATTASSMAVSPPNVQLTVDSSREALERVLREPAWASVILLALKLLELAIRHEVEQLPRLGGRAGAIGSAVLGMVDLIGAAALMVGWAAPLPELAAAALRLIQVIADENASGGPRDRRLAAILSSGPLSAAVVGAFRNAFEVTMHELVDRTTGEEESLAGQIVSLLEHHASRPYPSLTHLLLGFPWPSVAPDWRLEGASVASVLHALLNVLLDGTLSLPAEQAPAWVPTAYRLLAALTEHKATGPAVLRHLVSSGLLEQDLSRLAAVDPGYDVPDAVPRLRISLAVLQMTARAVLLSGLAARDIVETLYQSLPGGGLLLGRLLDAIDVPDQPLDIPRGPNGEDFTSEAYRALPTPELALQIDLAAVLRSLTVETAQRQGVPLTDADTGPVLAACATFNRRCAESAAVVRCVMAWRDLFQVSLPFGLKILRERGDSTGEAIWELLDVSLLPRVALRSPRPDVAALLATGCLHAAGALRDLPQPALSQARALAVLEQLAAILGRDSTAQSARTSLCGVLIDLVHVLVILPGRRPSGLGGQTENNSDAEVPHRQDELHQRVQVLGDVQRVLRRHGEQIVRRLAQLMQHTPLPTQALAAATLEVLVELDEPLPFAGPTVASSWAEAVCRAGVLSLLSQAVQVALRSAVDGGDGGSAAYFFETAVSLLNSLAARVPVGLVQSNLLKVLASSASSLDLPPPIASHMDTETEPYSAPDERFLQLTLPLLRLLLTLITAAPKNKAVVEEVIHVLEDRAEWISTVLRDRLRGTVISSDTMTAVEILTALLARLLGASPIQLPRTLAARWPVWLGYLAQLFAKYSTDRWWQRLHPPLSTAVDAAAGLYSASVDYRSEWAQARQICNNVLTVARLSADPGPEAESEVASRLLFTLRPAPLVDGTTSDLRLVVAYLRTLLLTRPVAEASAQQLTSKMDQLHQLSAPELNELLTDSAGVTFDVLSIPPLQKQQLARSRLGARCERVVTDLLQINYGVENALVVLWLHSRHLGPVSKLDATAFPPADSAQLRNTLWTALVAEEAGRGSVSRLLENEEGNWLQYTIWREIRVALKP